MIDELSFSAVSVCARALRRSKHNIPNIALDLIQNKTQHFLCEA
jgi:hypothetical protein